MPEQAPIRGRWTIHARHCQRLSDGSMCDVPTRVHGAYIEDGAVVEVVPVPDEAAVERAVRALDECNWRSGSLTLSTDMLVRAVLTAALDASEETEREAA